jgi:predicted HTH domain antitoxin
MSEKRRIEDDLSLTQKVSILLIGANSFQPVRGKLWFQKELFLIAQNIRELAEEADFESDFIGPYSEIADEELDQLKREGIVSKEKVELTPLGRDVANRLQGQIPPTILKLISEMKRFLNNLTKEELLGFIYYSYPEMRIESVEFAEIDKNRVQIAISLFGKNKVSLGKAALIAGMSQDDFISELKATGIKVFAE